MASRATLASRGVLDDADIEIFVIDETNTRVRPDRIARQIRVAGGRGLVALVGVQSNQYPRVPWTWRGGSARPAFPVCIGGFHVSGTLSRCLPGVQA